MVNYDCFRGNKHIFARNFERKKTNMILAFDPCESII